MNGLEWYITLCLFAITYAYFGYPMLLFFWGMYARKEVSEEGAAPASISVIIAARNEESVIERKIEETLELLWQGQPLRKSLGAGGSADLLVASDASDDRTDAVVQKYQHLGVHLVRLSERGGNRRCRADLASE